MGVRCPVGLTAPQTAAAIRAGISRIGEHPYLTDASRAKVLCGVDATLDPVLQGPARFAGLAGPALLQVDAILSTAQAASPRAPLLLALPETRPGFETTDLGAMQKLFGAISLTSIDPAPVSISGTGHAGGLAALRDGIDRIARGQDRICVVGGVDTYLHFGTIRWLDEGRRLAREGTRAGFPPGEAAAFVAIAREEELRRHQLRPLARVNAVACMRESQPFDADEGLQGKVLAEVIEAATSGLPAEQEISDTYGDINGERPRTEDWGFALMRTTRRFRDGTAYVTPVGSCGDVGAASGVLGCVLAVEAWRRGYAHGSRALVWAGSWNGLRGAALLERV
jgi:3-oxoacyl-[acyl-carrier-protein] synthase-1